jgi:biotin carboxyl carrier protein
MAAVKIARIGAGTYRADNEGQSEIVYVAGTDNEGWAFWNGHVWWVETRERRAGAEQDRAGSAATPDVAAPRTRGQRVPQLLTAPMPATVIKIATKRGDAVRKGDTLVVLEAMKMELPIRAPADGTVSSVNCREGDLVQPDTTLVEIE